MHYFFCVICYMWKYNILYVTRIVSHNFVGVSNAACQDMTIARFL